MTFQTTKHAVERYSERVNSERIQDPESKAFKRNRAELIRFLEKCPERPESIPPAWFDYHHCNREGTRYLEIKPGVCVVISENNTAITILTKSLEKKN